tara:strand:+ start:117 stop:503 length:387 start_codon:yes stop_codon:yes gene_type:complete
MVNFKNNNRRGRFRNNDRNFRRNNEGMKYKTDFVSSSKFQRKSPGKNNHNASKLVEKYNDLAREALANEDKILSENYFQHADHFTRVLIEQEKNRSLKVVNESENNKTASDNKENDELKNHSQNIVNS